MGPSLIFLKRLTHDVGSRCDKICKGVTLDLGSKLLKFSKRSVYDQDGSKKRKRLSSKISILSAVILPEYVQRVNSVC